MIQQFRVKQPLGFGLFYSIINALLIWQRNITKNYSLFSMLSGSLVTTAWHLPQLWMKEMDSSLTAGQETDNYSSYKVIVF
jgi:hypothetical protein